MVLNNLFWGYIGNELIDKHAVLLIKNFKKGLTINYFMLRWAPFASSTRVLPVVEFLHFPAPVLV